MAYPSSIDAPATNHSDSELMVTNHAAAHNAIAAEIIAIETELGLLPKGNFATVVARLSKPELLPPFYQVGTLAVGVGTVFLPIPFACTIQDVRMRARTAPVGASIIADVNKNGTTIFSTQANRPTIAAGANLSGTQTPNITALAAGDYLSVDIDQVGSTTAGTDLVLEILIVGR